MSIVLQKRRAGINGKQNNIVQQSNNLEGVYDKISNMIPLPRSRSNSVSSDSSNVSDDEDWDTHSDPVVQEPSGSKSFHREKSKSPDSGIGSRAASPLEEPPVPPSSCVDLPSTAQVNNVNPVNSGVQNSPITETPVDTKEQNNSGSAGSYTNERDNELGLDSDAENESKERAARIEREQAERREKQEKVNSKMQDPSALSIKEKAKMFGNWW